MSSTQRHCGRFLTSAIALTCWIGLVTTAGAAGYLYIADIAPDWSDGFIKRIGTETTFVDTIVATGAGLRGIAVDPAARKIYWTDVDAHTISWANLDGTGVAQIVTTGLSFPLNIDVHPAADLLVWGDQTLGQVGRAHLDGSEAGPLFSTTVDAGLAFDQTNNRIYWTCYLNSQEGEIRACDLDGTNAQTIVTGFGRPSWIALDVAGGKIYWTDYVNDVVRRANLDGTGKETLYVVGSNLNPDGIALDVAAGKVYWAQEQEYVYSWKIMRMNLDGTNAEDVLIGDFGGIADLVFVDLPAAEVTDLSSSAAGILTSWPNPFTDRSTIRLDLSGSRPVRLGVYAPDGRRIVTFVDGVLPQGSHEMGWSGVDERGRSVRGGVYFYRADIDGKITVAKVILAR